MWIMAPVMRDPPLYTLADLNSWVRIDDVLDAHEIMSLEGMAAERQRLRNESPFPRMMP